MAASAAAAVFVIDDSAEKLPKLFFRSATASVERPHPLEIVAAAKLVERRERKMREREREREREIEKEREKVF